MEKLFYILTNRYIFYGIICIRFFLTKKARVKWQKPFIECVYDSRLFWRYPVLKIYI